MANLTSVGVTAGVPTSGTGTVSTLDNLPTLLGTVKAASTAPSAVDPALVVSLSPNGVNANGQATMANSAPVVLASNQSNLPINIAQVNGSTIAVGSGVQATAERVTLATDSPGIVALGQTTKSASVPVTMASDQGTNDYPPGATAITASATGTTAATTATLAGTAGKTTYLTGFSIRANATAAATGNATVTGTITGTLNFTQWTAALASGIGLVEPNISKPIPASAQNTSIAVVSAAPGTGGVVSVTAWGYQL